MSQDDFRKLLSTPRAAPGGQTGIKGTFSGGGMRALGMANRTARAPVPQTPRSSEGGSNKHKYKKPSQKNPNKEASSATSKYRDRATERRQGINPDYVETEQILTTLEEAAADVAPEVIYEQSKFLGGDREHTHLVKGLDYALLKKVRQEEKDETPEDDLDEVFEAVEKSTAKAEARATEQLPEERPEMSSALAGNIYKYAIEEAGRQPPRVNDMFIPGRTVFIFEVPITKKSKRSKDGVVEDNNPFAVPTTVVRSKADVDLHQAGEVENPEADMVMKKVMHVLSAIRTGERKVGDSEAELKAKRRAAAAAAAKAAAQKLQDEEVLPMVEPDVDGEDIFADVGRDYVVEPAHGNEAPVPENAMDVDGDEHGPMVGPSRPDDIDMSHYFGEESDEDQEAEDAEDAGPYVQRTTSVEEAPELGPARPSEMDMSNYFDEDSDEEGSGGSEGGDAEVSASTHNESGETLPSKYAPPTAPEYTTPLNEKALSGRKPRLDDLEVDEDADYYSAYGLGMGGRSYTGTAYDSDDEEDEGQSTILIDKGTHKNKRAQLGRFDFDTEEGFNRYKDTVEVIPKTSFQYGVKMSEGRKTGSWDDGKGKGLSKDEKLDRDWQRISRLMEKNSGAGGGNQKSKSRPDDGSSGGGGGDNRSKRRKNR
jgi:IK cytokine